MGEFGKFSLISMLLKPFQKNIYGLEIINTESKCCLREHKSAASNQMRYVTGGVSNSNSIQLGKTFPHKQPTVATFSKLAQLAVQLAVWTGSSGHRVTVGVYLAKTGWG